MALDTHNKILARWAAGFGALDIITGEQQASAALSLLGTGGLFGTLIAMQDMPGALPTGVTSFIPLSAHGALSTGGSILIARMTKFGELDISGASGTFTDSDAAPTLTELGVSRQTPLCPLIHVKNTINATPGSFTFTYTDQDGNTGNVSNSFTITASANTKLCQVPTLTSTSGDTGIIDITAASRTGGTTPTGVLEFWGMAPIGRMSLVGSTGVCGEYADFLLDQINLVKLGINEKIGFMLMIQPASFTGAFVGAIHMLGDE